MASYYGFWNYWNLYHKVTFDGVNRLILINEGETDIDVQIDIYSAWKQWSLEEQNTKYLKALNVIGGEPTVGAEQLDATYFLINGWRLKPYPGSYNLVIGGNLFVEGGGNIAVQADINPLFPNNISTNLNTSVIVRRIETVTSGSSSTFEGIVTASLEPNQSSSLANIETLITIMNSQLADLWQIHGLDPSESLYVNKTTRVVGDIVQVIANNGTGSAAETTIIRI